jgi:hypothetical protein
LTINLVLTLYKKIISYFIRYKKRDWFGFGQTPNEKSPKNDILKNQVFINFLTFDFHFSSWKKWFYGRNGIVSGEGLAPIVSAYSRLILVDGTVL